MSHSPSHDGYQVIARKYRPQTFTDVIGQDPIVTTLKNALKHNKIAHGYLFCGCRGTGKTTLARVFAKALNCQHPAQDHEPCGRCSSCEEISQSRSLDVIEIDGASHRGIDDIRQINETIGYAPSSGKYKIYIIDEVHMLTKEAFNALLKTLEEPPANVKFFFATTEPHKVLPTIMSRCQRFDLSRIPLSLVKEKLHKIASDLHAEVEDEAVELVARLSEGSMRDAESLFDQILCFNEGILTADKVTTSVGLAPSSTFFELDQAVMTCDLSYAFVLAGKIFSTGKDLTYFLDSLMEHYRTILSMQLGQPIELGAFAEKKYKESSQSIYSQPQCLSILEYLISAVQQLPRSSFKRIHLEMILLHIIRSKKRISIDTLIYRLEQMQKKELSTPSMQMNATPTTPQRALEPPVATEKNLETPKVIEERVSSPLETPKIESAKSLQQEDPLYSTPIATEKKLEIPTVIEERISSPLESTKIEATTSTLQKEAAPSMTVATEKIPETPKAKQEIPPSPSVAAAAQTPKIIKPQAKHETVLRFAAVELEGVFSKN